MTRSRLTSRAMSAILAALVPLAAGDGFADDWPQWRGPQRDGVWRETGIVGTFAESGLEYSWRTPIGSGYSGPVVADGRVYVLDYSPKPDTETLEAVERIVCLDEETGKILWTDEWETHYRSQMHSYATGPRASAVADGDLVFGMGATGVIRCVRAGTGEVVWTRDSVAEYDATVPIWGMSCSPLTDGDLAIFVTGGSPTADDSAQLRAYDKRTGREVWKAIPANYEMGYSPPVIIEAGGTRQLIAWDPKGIHALNPATGEILWSHEYQTKSNMSIATPQLSGTRLLVSSFYSGSLLLDLHADKPGAGEIWRVQGKNEFPQNTEGLHSVITTPVIQGDYFYGTCSYGEFRCVSMADSSRVWTRDDLTRQGRWGSCFFVRNGDRWFMNNDLGELLIVKLSPEGAEVLGRTKLIDVTTSAGFGPRKFFDDTVNWVHPAYANRHIITRNDREIVRASLAAK